MQPNNFLEPTDTPAAQKGVRNWITMSKLKVKIIVDIKRLEFQRNSQRLLR